MKRESGIWKLELKKSDWAVGPGGRGRGKEEGAGAWRGVGQRKRRCAVNVGRSEELVYYCDILISGQL